MKILFSILALISTLPCAYLSFKNPFIKELKRQMVGPENPAGVGTKSVSFPYRLIAHLYIGKENKWLELLNPTSTVNKKLESDKSQSLRIFIYFILAIIFGAIALFFT